MECCCKHAIALTTVGRLSEDEIDGTPNLGPLGYFRGTIVFHPKLSCYDHGPFGACTTGVRLLPWTHIQPTPKAR
jgi:hypothetical protein